MKETSNYIWRIRTDKSIKVSASNLWNIISKPSNLELFHPFCKKNPIKNWPGKSSIDEIYYYNELVFERNFIEWFDNKGYDLLIGEKKGPKSLVKWRIDKISKNHSNINITIYPHKFNKEFSIGNFFKFYILVYPVIKKYLNQVLKGLEWHIKTEKKIPKNMFGNNKFFSTKN